MAKKLSAAQLKKKLKDFSQEELIYLIGRIYQSCPEAADLINAELGDENYSVKLLEEAKEKVRKEFFPTRGMGRLSLSSAKSVIASFKRICKDPAMVLDLQLYYVENGVEFTNTYGDINESFYNSMGSVYHTVTETLNKLDDEDLYLQFEERLKAVLDETDGIGWGFSEDLSDSYYSLKWVKG